MATSTVPSTGRRAALEAAAEAYFNGLARKDLTIIPWHDDVIFRGPLAPGFPEPMRGRRQVVEWFTGLLPALGEVNILEHYCNESLTTVATRADVGLVQPAATLRVIDRFVVDGQGRIVEQENHYDPRPALAQPTGTLSAEERTLLVQLLTGSADRFLDSIDEVPAGMWAAKPRDGGWSVAECAEHVALTEEWIRNLINGQVLASDPVPDKPRQADNEAVVRTIRDRTTRIRTYDFLEPRGRWKTPGDIADEYRAKRGETIEWVEHTADPLHFHFAPMPGLGELDAYQWLLLLAAHTDRHVAQIEETKAELS